MKGSEDMSLLELTARLTLLDCFRVLYFAVRKAAERGLATIADVYLTESLKDELHKFLLERVA